MLPFLFSHILFCRTVFTNEWGNFDHFSLYFLNLDANTALLFHEYSFFYISEADQYLGHFQELPYSLKRKNETLIIEHLSVEDHDDIYVLLNNGDIFNIQWHPIGTTAQVHLVQDVQIYTHQPTSNDVSYLFPKDYQEKLKVCQEAEPCHIVTDRVPFSPLPRSLTDDFSKPLNSQESLWKKMLNRFIH